MRSVAQESRRRRTMSCEEKRVPTVCVLALSAIPDDPRVRRQAEAFHLRGWSVMAVGLPGAKSTQPEWPMLTPSSEADCEIVSNSIEKQPIRSARSGGAGMINRVAVRKSLLSVFRTSTKPFFATAKTHDEFERIVKEYVNAVVLAGERLKSIARRQILNEVEWQEDRFWRSFRAANDILTCAKELSADVWLANDWTMLPVAAQLAREKGGVYGYDTHEFATEEYAESPHWRRLTRPMVSAMEREYIRSAAVVSAVSSGIAERLDSMYSLPKPSLTIRNTPHYQEIPFRPTHNGRIDVLYHGIVVPNRGIEATIESVPLWGPQFTFTIRGPENPDFTPRLRARITALGIQSRVRIVPPVPMTELVSAAATSDIGFFALPGHSRHNEFALPNKFFEYVMAGLALCTTDLPEMAHLIRKYDFGITVAAVEPAAIAAAINALTPERIDGFKRNALLAAYELSWERESNRLVAAYDAALSPVRANVP